MKRRRTRRRIVRGSPDSIRPFSTFVTPCGIFPLLAEPAMPAQGDPFYFVLGRTCGSDLELPVRAEMEKTLRDYQRLAEEALTMRVRAIRLYRELVEAGKDESINKRMLGCFPLRHSHESVQTRPSSDQPCAKTWKPQ
jgi:hypothetical protein